MELNNNDIVQPNKGLNTDFNPLNQPQGTYRYAMNAIIESENGDFLQLSNELGNVKIFDFKDGFKCIGSVYIDDGQTVLFLTRTIEFEVDSKKQYRVESEIGIYDSNENYYQTWINDAKSAYTRRLNFRFENKIQAVYRLRRGCEKMIYWVDGLNPNRAANLSKRSDYLINNEIVDAKRFLLQKTYTVTPSVQSLEILEGEGNLPNGSLKVLLQYVDNDKNGTKWVNEIPNINIYTDTLDKPFGEIDGSINTEKVKEFNNVYSNKAIKVVYSGFDYNYKFCRLAFVHYYSNTKKPTACYISDIVPIENNSISYIYTGSNYVEKIPYEELMLFNNNNNIGSSKTITQKDNRLIFGNSKGEDINYRILQKHASKIAVDCVLKKVNIKNVKDKHNSKNPFVSFFGSGFMPGEVVSLGIVFTFEDFTESPVFHIPGIRKRTEEDNSGIEPKQVHKVYSTIKDENLLYYPMRDFVGLATNAYLGNTNQTIKYTQREGCGDFDYWGRDCTYEPLLGKNVRFHRLPTIEYLKKCGENIPEITSPDEKYIMGLAFSNLPDFLENDDFKYLDSISKRVTGFYFVRQEVKEKDKTILDTGYLLPLNRYRDFSCMSVPFGDFSYTSNSPIEGKGFGAGVSPDFNTFMILSPSSLFDNKTFDEYTDIIPTGEVSYIKNETRSGFLIQDASDLRTDAVENEREITKQNDGADLKSIIRDLELNNIANKDFKYIDNWTIKKSNSVVHKLNPYEKANINTLNKSIFNMDSMSSALYITSLNEERILFKGSTFINGVYKEINNVIPKIYIVKNLVDFYSDFQRASYKRISDTYDRNYIYDMEKGRVPKSLIGTFRGDSFICGYRHTISSYCGTSPRQPKVKPDNSFWKIFLIGVLSLVVTALTFGTALAIVGGVLLAAGNIFYGIRAQVNADEFNKRFKEDWTNGLEYLFQDNFFVSCFLTPKPNESLERFGYQDDTIKVYNHVIGDFIFETPINISLRVEPNNDDTNYLRPFTEHLPERNKYKVRYEENLDGVSGEPTINKLIENELWKSFSVGVPIDSKEERFFLSRLCEKDSSRIIRKKNYQGRDYYFNEYGRRMFSTPEGNKFSEHGEVEIGGYKFLGAAKPVFYCINQDYMVSDSLLKLYTIPFEYSFCSECRETFPHRINWSEVSFSEQLIDNYRLLKPNNYKDLDGENGEIVNLFVMNNQLYIHTANGLWIQPTNYQERITNGVVSYIGTGEFGSLPAQLIVNSKTGTSSGLHSIKDSILTHKGYFFVSQTDCKVYWFNGQLNCISDLGLSKWFFDKLSNTGFNNKREFLNLRLNYDFNNDRLLVTERSYNGWTLSFSLKTNSWISFHSYIPEEYIQIEDKMYTTQNSGLYLHTKDKRYEMNNLIPKYQTFYDIFYPFIIEYVNNERPITNKIFDSIRFSTEAKRYLDTAIYSNRGYIEEPLITFNKALLYNSYQCTDYINLLVKDNLDSDRYLPTQIENITNGVVSVLDKTERDWSFNNFRDMIVNYNINMFDISRHRYYDIDNPKYLTFIPDKVLNRSIFGNKEWYNLDSMRDKYLVVRLIFDTFADVKLIYNFSVDYNTISQH